MGDTLVPILLRRFEDYFHCASFEQIEKDSLDPESETYFNPQWRSRNLVVFSRSTGVRRRSSSVEMDKSFEIQRICREMSRWFRQGNVYFQAGSPTGFEWVWLVVYGKRNVKAQDFYTAFDLNDLVNTSISPEIPWIQTEQLRAFEG